MAGGLNALATYAQRTVTLVLFGATCYYGAAFIHSSYLIRQRQKLKRVQETSYSAVRFQIFDNTLMGLNYVTLLESCLFKLSKISLRKF